MTLNNSFCRFLRIPFFQTKWNSPQVCQRKPRLPQWPQRTSLKVGSCCFPLILCHLSPCSSSQLLLLLLKQVILQRGWRSEGYLQVGQQVGIALLLSSFHPVVISSLSNCNIIPPQACSPTVQTQEPSACSF